MHQYKVISKGFMNGMSYDPEGKRRILYSETPLDPVPAWLKPIKSSKPAPIKTQEPAKAGPAPTENHQKHDPQDVAAMATPAEPTSISMFGVPHEQLTPAQKGQLTRAIKKAEKDAKDAEGDNNTESFLGEEPTVETLS